jgi:4-hydroxythreonine-4-phosphate dehydrogenase
VRPLAISIGDPAGIGPEVVLKAAATLPFVPLVLFGDWEWTRAAAEATAAPFDFLRKEPRAAIGDEPRIFVDLGLSGGKPLLFGAVDETCGRIALASIEAAADAVSAGSCSALVTAPIHKQAIARAGAGFPGHTELLARRTGRSEYGADYAMYFDSPSLRVALLSVHVPLRQAIEMATAERVDSLCSLVSAEFARLYGRDPLIAVAGINPHAGEGGMFGDEEEAILRGVELAGERGISVTGPWPPDTVFHRAASGDFDVVIAAYHDQGLIAVKTLAFDRSVNVTLGLPWLRASVDHGTAFDIAGRGIADEAPMKYAIEWAWQHAERYRT